MPEHPEAKVLITAFSGPPGKLLPFDLDGLEVSFKVKRFQPKGHLRRFAERGADSEHTYLAFDANVPESVSLVDALPRGAYTGKTAEVMSPSKNVLLQI